MEVNDALYGLKKLALEDPAVREALLATRLADNPLKEFSRATYQIPQGLASMDRIVFIHAAMRRSTNGGGENSPMLRCEDDYYEIFFSEIS